MKGEYHEACSTCGGGRICPDPWARSHAADFSRRSRRDVHAGSNAEPGLLLDDVFDGHVVVHADAARQAAARYQHDVAWHGWRVDGRPRYRTALRSIPYVRAQDDDLHDLRRDDQTVGQRLR